MWGKTIEDDKIKCNTILGSNDKTKVRRLDEVGAEGRVEMRGAGGEGRGEGEGTDLRA